MAGLGAWIFAAALIPAPEGWRPETFEFPLKFARTIPYEGSEHLRFAPSWDRFADENGFSYVFLWDVKAKPVATEDLEDHLEIYFNGLMKGVAPARELTATPIPTSAALHPMTGVAGWTLAYGAQVRTWNAFSKGEALLLHGEITQRACGPDRMQILFAFSQAPRDRPIWEGLRRVRQATQCGNPGSKP